MNNVLKFEQTIFNKTTNVYGAKDLIENHHKQLGLKEKETLERWVEFGFPKPYPVINKTTGILTTYQTYYLPFGRTIDNGKCRLQSKYYDKLLHNMFVVLQQIDNGFIQVVNNNATVLPLMNEYLAHLKGMVEKGTMSTESYQSKVTLVKRLNVVINDIPHLVKTKVTRWTASEVQMLWNNMFNFTKSRNTKRLWLNVIRDTFSMGILFKKIPLENGNVIEQWMKFLPNKKELRVASDSYLFDLENTIKVWDFKKMQSFIDSIHDQRFKLAIEVGVYCGLRVGEIFGLEFKDLIVGGHEGKDYLRISGQTLPIERGKKYELKTARGLNRMIPLPKRLAVKLTKYRESVLSDPYAVSNNIMFPNCHKGKWDWHNSSSSRTALENVMVGEFETPSKIRYHFFRHWIATQWLRHDIYELYNVSYYLGHKNLAVTARTYTHVYQLKHEDKCDKVKFLNGDLF